MKEQDIWDFSILNIRKQYLNLVFVNYDTANGKVLRNPNMRLINYLHNPSAELRSKMLQ